MLKWRIKDNGSEDGLESQLHPRFLFKKFRTAHDGTILIKPFMCGRYYVRTTYLPR